MCFSFFTIFPFNDTVKADWWDNNYDYCKVLPINDADNSYRGLRINVTYSSGGDINCSSNCQSDFDDVRFLNADNDTVLDYWRESYTPSTDAVFWVELPSDVETDDYIVMYYGHTGATYTGDGEDTFIFFDDFSGTSQDANKWDDYDGLPDWSNDGTVELSGGDEIVTDNEYGDDIRVRCRSTTTEQDIWFIAINENTRTVTDRIQVGNSDSGTYDGDGDYDSFHLFNEESNAELINDQDGGYDIRGYNTYKLMWTSSQCVAVQNDTHSVANNIRIIDNPDHLYMRSWTVATLTCDWVFIGDFIDGTNPSCGTPSIAYEQPAGVTVPIVVTNEATGVEETNATLSGTLSDNGGADTTCWFQYGDETPPTDNNVSQDVVADGATFTYNWQSLTPGKLYYFDTEANNSAGWDGTGGIKSFLTKPNTPTGASGAGGEGWVNVSWTGATGADKYLVRYKTGSAPTSVTDGTLFGNVTSLYINSSILTGTYYFSIWSFASEGGFAHFSDSYDTTSATQEEVIVYSYNSVSFGGSVEVTQSSHSIVYVSDSMSEGWYNATQVHTIQEGITNVTSGGTVYIWNGTYTEAVDINKTVTIIGNSSADTTVTSTSITLDVMTDWVNISNLNITTTSFGDIGVDLRDSNYTNVSNCRFYSVTGDSNTRCAKMGGSCYANLYNNNFTVDSSVLYMIYTNEAFENATVFNNSFYGSLSNQIRIKQGENFTFSNNSLYIGYFILIETCNSSIENNTFISPSSGYSVVFPDNCNLLSFRNNTMESGWGYQLYETYNITFSDNTINDKDVYFVNTSDVLISGDYGEIIVINCDNVTIDSVTGINYSSCPINMLGTVSNLTITNVSVDDSLGYLYGIYCYGDFSNLNINNFTLPNINANANDGLYIEGIVNITIRDCLFDGGSDGSLELAEGSNITVYNVTINSSGGMSITDCSYFVNVSYSYFNNSDYGLYCTDYQGIIDYNIFNNTFNNNSVSCHLEEINNVSFYNNTVTNNSATGLYLENTDNSVFYNNYFANNTEHASEDGCSGNHWNTTKTSGTNIIGGAYLGGNYWDNYTGSDTDGDGLGDTDVPFYVGDYLPLTFPSLDAEVNDTTWIIGEVPVGSFAQKNFTFYQNGTANVDITIGISNSNLTFVNYTDYGGVDCFSANFTNDSWVTEYNIHTVPYNGTLKTNFAPGSLVFGVRILMPEWLTGESKKEDFEVVLTVTEHTG